MAKLLDPDLRVLHIKGEETPEPTVREMMIHYYTSNGIGWIEARVIVRELIEKHNKIVEKSLAEGQ